MLPEEDGRGTEVDLQCEITDLTKNRKRGYGLGQKGVERWKGVELTTGRREFFRHFTSTFVMFEETEMVINQTKTCSINYHYFY